MNGLIIRPSRVTRRTGAGGSYHRALRRGKRRPTTPKAAARGLVASSAQWRGVAPRLTEADTILAEPESTGFWAS